MAIVMVMMMIAYPRSTSIRTQAKRFVRAIATFRFCINPPSVSIPRYLQQMTYHTIRR